MHKKSWTTSKHLLSFFFAECVRARGGGNGLNGEQSLDRGQEGGAEREREREVGLITVPSAFVLRRIRQPCPPAIL